MSHKPVVVRVFAAPRPRLILATPIESAIRTLTEIDSPFEVRRENGRYLVGESYGDNGFLVLAHGDELAETARRAQEVYEG